MFERLLETALAIRFWAYLNQIYEYPYPNNIRIGFLIGFYISKIYDRLTWYVRYKYHWYVDVMALVKLTDMADRHKP